jgi:hypothetical protein
MSEIGKKRGAQGDLSRENCESIVGEEKNDVDLSGGGNGEGWQKAAPEVIQERRYLSAMSIQESDPPYPLPPILPHHRILKPTLPGMMSSPAAEMTKPIGDGLFSFLSLTFSFHPFHQDFWLTKQTHLLL